MVLGFKPEFKPLILAGTKIHTIREDKNNRWAPENIIHMATGVRTKNYNQFCLAKCTYIQTIKIQHSAKLDIYIDGLLVDEYGIGFIAFLDMLSKNDGFKTRGEFFKWPAWNKKTFEGKIIHWTNFKYSPTIINNIKPLLCITKTA